MTATFESALQQAVERGVPVENGYYRFFDPGIPLVSLRDLPVVRERNLVYRHPWWYDSYDWAKREDSPQERLLRLPVAGSFLKTFAEQERLLKEDEEVPSVRTVATFLVLYALVTGNRLLPYCWVRCCDQGPVGGRVIVGDFRRDGLGVSDDWGDHRSEGVGLAAARKS